jgi:hypothetical protein
MSPLLSFTFPLLCRRMHFLFSSTQRAVRWTCEVDPYLEMDGLAAVLSLSEWSFPGVKYNT